MLDHALKCSKAESSANSIVVQIIAPGPIQSRDFTPEYALACACKCLAEAPKTHLFSYFRFLTFKNTENLSDADCFLLLEQALSSKDTLKTLQCEQYLLNKYKSIIPSGAVEKRVYKNIWGIFSKFLSNYSYFNTCVKKIC